MWKYLQSLFRFRKAYGPCGGAPRYAWPADRKLEVKLVASSVPRYLTAAQVDYELLKAVTQWQRCCGVDLRHVPCWLPADDHEHPEILVRFGRMPNREWDGAGGNLGFTFYPDAADPHEIHGDIFLDPGEPWTVSSSQWSPACRLYCVLLHELGHAIGLEHSASPGDVMWPTYNPAADRLDKGDVREALRRYPFPSTPPDTGLTP